MARKKRTGKADVINVATKKISKEVKDHVDEHIGVTNEILDEFARKLCPRLYKGLFNPSTNLLRLNICAPFTIILNVGFHFVCVHTTGKKVFYIDSYGLMCRNRVVWKFLRQFKIPIVINRARLQSPKSRHCGMYALLFATYLDLPKKPFKLKFHNRARKKNDQLCMLYLDKLVTHIDI
jgi:hypothetical protein